MKTLKLLALTCAILFLVLCVYGVVVNIMIANKF
jgi:hypothetical protein